ncbi:LysE family transporter [Clostridiaceae bacterium M8S5]|nr:LysE family transporter [Clostridiaceae bacterium M8S5]
MAMNSFIQGFLLGFAYVAPIGMQNIYVINSALVNKKAKAFAVAFITVFFDIALALTCFFGMGIVMEKIKILKLFILFIGSIVVIYIGIQLIKSDPQIDKEVDTSKSIPQIILACFLITWANPQALIDGSLLLGGFKASLPKDDASIFISGVCIASATWFISLTGIVSFFKGIIRKNHMKIINIFCGIIIIYYGLKLGYSFIVEIL